MKRFLLLLLVVFLPLTTVPVGAESAFMAPQRIEYIGGGVVFRLESRDNTDSIDIAYWDFDMPYILRGSQGIWEIEASGGREPYTISAYLYRQELSDRSVYYDYYDEVDAFSVDDELMYTFFEEGKYIWMIYISDASGQQVILQTKSIPVYDETNENNPYTLPGKINCIIASEINDNMDAYHRALALHDWLVNNAVYDYSYYYDDPDGVLLYGKGVCDSFAQAYCMLMSAAGVECVYVSGYGNGGRHAWNLVKIDDVWYHVDCTWDVGGSHEYFMLTDEQIAPTHIWNRNGGGSSDEYDNIVPDAEGGEYTNPEDGSEIGYSDFVAYDRDDLTDKFIALVTKATYAEIHFINKTGLDDAALIKHASTLNSQMRQNGINASITRLTSVGDELRIYTLVWNSQEPFILLQEKEIELAVDQSTQLHVRSIYPENQAITWYSSDAAIAQIDANGFLTAKKAGECTIFAAISDYQKAEVKVVVLPSAESSFALEKNIEDDILTLSWARIPGVTEYIVYKQMGETVTVLQVVQEPKVGIQLDELQGNARVHVEARRVVQGVVQLTYHSETYPMRLEDIHFDCYLPEKLQIIDDEAFAGSAIKSVYIPDDITLIGEKAFADCQHLHAIRIPASVCNICMNVFEGSDIDVAVVTYGSPAHRYMQQYYPWVELVFE